MIKRETKLKVSDNSGAKFVQCIGFFKSIKCDTVNLNDLICVCLKKIDKKRFLRPKGRIRIIKKQKIEKNKEEKNCIYKAIIISCKKKIKRIDGCFIKTKQNRVVLISESWKFLGSRIIGPLLKETRKRRKIPFFKELISYAKSRI